MPNLLETLDKSDWQTFRFDEIAHNISKRVEPGATDLTIYVGLEHLDSGSVHIKRTGTPADVDGTKLLVYAGDVIFGRRRAYQRKAAVATFDGICSAHALVLRAKPDVIEPSLFPFFLHSDAFMHRVVDISVGGLSPTVNWGHLKVEEFLLPPRDQQARLAELLWAADDAGEKQSDLASTLRTMSSASFDKIYASQHCKEVPLKECLEYSQYGTSELLENAGEVPVLRMNNLQNGRLELSDLKYASRTVVGDNLLLKQGDILFNRTNSYELVGKVAMFEGQQEMSFASYLIRLKVDEAVVYPEYINLYLNSNRGQERIRRYRAPGVSQTNINPENLKKVMVPLVPKDEQLVIIDLVRKISEQADSSHASSIQSRELKQTLINQIFSA